MPRLLIVSNRLPVTIAMTQARPEIQPSPGGLASGLTGPHESSRGLWFGWPGDLARLSEKEKAAMQGRLAELRLVPVEITGAELEGFYTGFSNSVLWPLFHYLIDRIPYQPIDWRSYRKVNERFARIVCEHYRPGDLIWVHDYQLALVPAMIRQRLKGARIGFFLHIPFPSAEMFRLLPMREQILYGLLGADVIGFHTYSYLREFINTLIHTMGMMPSPDHLDFEGRRVRLGVYPMGIDARGFEALALDARVKKACAKLKAELGDTRLLLGVDRLDYTKGIPRRLLTIGELLEKNPELQGRVRFVQVAVPSRLAVPQYELVTSEVQQLVGQINGRFSTHSSVPIHFLHRSFSQSELVAYYLAADIMLVTPLRDGMNLVAKEFVASRTDQGGVLVLSEFAGAASEMGEAVQVNPYDIKGTAGRILQALQMPSSARRLRMKALRERVLNADVHRWAQNFIHDLEKGEPAPAHPQHPPVALDQQIARAARILWLLDYDGTLVPFAKRPELAEPDSEILELLARLAADPRMQVHVVSDRKHQLLTEWLGDLPIGLHAEHGLWSREPGGEWHLNLKMQSPWKKVVRPLFQEFSLRTPGSLVEEKTVSLAFHYRMSDAEFGEWQARELKIHLSHVLSNLPVEVLSGNKVVEVKPHSVHKGIIVPRLLANAPGALVVAAGDDISDESLFHALPDDVCSICIGSRPSMARFSLPNVEAMRAILRNAVKEAGELDKEPADAAGAL